MEPRGPQRKPRAPLTLEGELVASSTGHGAELRAGRARVPPEVRLRQVAEVDGNKLTIDFDKAGRKRVVDSFVARAGG